MTTCAFYQYVWTAFWDRPPSLETSSINSWMTSYPSIQRSEPFHIFCLNVMMTYEMSKTLFPRIHSVGAYSFVFFASLFFVLGFRVSPVRATTCPAANPNDNIPDAAALQACLNQGGIISLDPGTPGYIIATGLHITQPGTVITSSQAPTKATLIADSSLRAQILRDARSYPAASIQIANIIFDGNRSHRDDSVCSGWRDPFATNVGITSGNGFIARDIESRNALCGSSFVVSADSFEITNSWLHDNGAPSGNGPAPWADGITLAKCSNGYVHDNTVENNTDVDIVDGGGQDCRIVNNTIRRTSVFAFAFAGLAIHDFANADADHTGSRFQGNTIIPTSPNTLGFSISVGGEPWSQGLSVGGTISNNTISGADINLAVEGYRNGTITGNMMPSPGGDCNQDYTVSDTSNACLQSGWFTASASVGGSCSPTGEVITSTCGTNPTTPSLR